MTAARTVTRIAGLDERAVIHVPEWPPVSAAHVCPALWETIPDPVGLAGMPLFADMPPYVIEHRCGVERSAPREPAT